MTVHREKAQRWFESQHQKMRADLLNVRAVHDHPTAKGDGTEVHWLQVLKRRLPARYCAERAFVIDADGGRSQQMDIVIHDRQFCPVLLDTEGCISIPAESVYAVIEVKQTIDAGNIDYAADKVESVRKLRRTSSHFQWAKGRTRTEPKPILGGIVAFTGGWTKSFATSVKREALKHTGNRAVDIGCALEHGVFEVEKNAKGRRSVFVSGPEASSMVFFLRLLYRLQLMGTVPAIDYRQYTSLVAPSADRRR